MDALFRFIVEYEALVYLILLIGAVFAARSLWKAWAEWRSSVFGLEKELSFQKVRVSGAMFILLIMIGLSQFCLVSFIVPFLPATTFRPTPTADLLQTSSGEVTQPVADQNAQPSAAIAPTGIVDCVPGQIIFSSPKPGGEVQGKIILTGTVNVPNFGFFKYEYATQGSETWATIAAGDKIVIEGELGAWDTSQLVPGDYQIRLQVTDNLGKPLPACVLPVRVIAP
ncbi:MAG: hypothetical protein NTW32_06275 [Chloroflexi bacterium]|nr:hypothetical protein [Chloroflexota bacterium]